MERSRRYGLPDERVVAFIDILGFSDLLSRAKRDSNMLNIVQFAVGHMRAIRQMFNTAQIETDIPVPVDLRIPHFSDSIVISQPVDLEPLDNIFFLYTCIDVCAMPLLNGVLTRGGISVGWMHHEDDTLYGEGWSVPIYLRPRVPMFRG
jgi:hypothetical protein